MDKKISKALSLSKETDEVEFKRRFDTNSTRDWCEIIKDIVAMANSGGGIIIFGLKNNGSISNSNLSDLVELDPAIIADKLYRYTGSHFSDYQIIDLEKSGSKIYGLLISRSPIPMVFIKPGTYPISDKEQRTAFSRGTIYFRHGTKSEPGNQDDIRKSIQYEIESTRNKWFSNIRKIVEAPLGSQAILVPPSDKEEGHYQSSPIEVITDDPASPKYVKIDYDITHPYRCKELIIDVNKKLDKHEINQHDIVAINKVHGIKEIESFCHTPKYGTSQYSPTFIDWIVDQFKRDKDFFNNTRGEYYKNHYRK